MSKIPRQTISVVGAVIGANLIGIVSYGKPVKSLDCFQPLEQVGATINSVRANLHTAEAQHRPRTDVPYYENDPWAGVQPVLAEPRAAAANPGRTQAPTPAPATPARNLTITDAEIDAAIARERSQSPAPDAQIGSKCVIGVDGKTYCGEG